MRFKDKKPDRPHWHLAGPARWLVVVLVFLAIILYLALAVEPRLIYSGFGIFHQYVPFQKDLTFLRRHISLPGGFAYVSTGWISQWYYHNWLGALAITALLAGLYLGVDLLIRFHGTCPGIHIPFLPVMFCLLMFGRYDHPTPWMVCLAIAVWMAVLYLRIALPWPVANLGLAGLVFAACYLLTGGTAIITAAFIIIAEVALRKRPIVAGSFLILAIGIILLVGIWLLALEPLEAFVKASPVDQAFLAWLDTRARWLCAYLCGSVLVSPYLPFAWRGLGRLLARIVKARDRIFFGHYWPGLATILAVIGMYILPLAYLQHGTKYQLAINKAGMDDNWQAVLDLADKVKGRYQLTPASILEIDRALIHKGLLGDHMFRYPQDPRILALFSLDGIGQGLQFAKRLEIHLDLADLNAAEQDAYELLEIQGPVPFVLLAIAKIHIAKGQYEAAEVVLHNMLAMPGTRHIARVWLDKLKDPERLDSDPQISRLRRFKRIKDTQVRDRLFDQLLLDLLDEHPGNRPALEYLMGYYLLTRQDERIVANISRLMAAGYKVLPQHYHQALLIYADRTRRPISLPGLAMDTAVVDQFVQFNKAAKVIRQDRAAAARALAAEFGDTYMYYYLFGISGVR